MDENNKKIVIGVGVAVVVAILAYMAFYPKGSNLNTGNSGGTAAVGGTAGEQVKSATRQAVSSGVVVPDATSTVSADVAKPQIVAQASPGTSAKFRSFSISVSDGKFTPNTVIVNVGDTARLNITAIDKNYDFYQPDYGLSAPLPKGMARPVEFQVSAEGKYTFYCKSCGGPDRGPVGYVIVVPKK